MTWLQFSYIDSAVLKESYDREGHNRKAVISLALGYTFKKEKINQ